MGYSTTLSQRDNNQAGTCYVYRQALLPIYRKAAVHCAMVSDGPVVVWPLTAACEKIS